MMFGRAQLLIMQKTINNALFGVIAMPTILASSLTINPATIDQVISSKQSSFETVIGLIKEENKENDLKDTERKQIAAKIDAFYESKNMKLAGHGMGMVIASEKYGLDPYMMAAIATKETTGGNAACPYTAKRTGDIRYTYNVFGWGSCKIYFESYEDGFDTIARNLTGNNPKTARYYSGKDTISILETYNPRHVVRDYPEQIVAIMETIKKVPVNSELAMK